MAIIAKLQCIDPKGLPALDEDGQPTEAPLMHSCIQYRFKPNEIVYLDAPVAQWLAKKAPGRLKCSQGVNTMESAVIDGEVVVIDKSTRKPIPAKELKAKAKSLSKLPPGVTVDAEGSKRTPHPPESPATRLKNLNAGEGNADVSVG